jgi:hypothetical protein
MEGRSKKQTISLDNLGDFSPRDLLRNSAVLEPLKDVELHAKALWGEIERLMAVDKNDLARIIARIDLIRVEHPEWTGSPHNQQIASQMRIMLTKKNYRDWFLEYPKKVYQAIIDDLETGGGLAKYVGESEKVRRNLGIATPVLLMDAMERIKKALGKESAIWSVDVVKEISAFLKDKSLAEIDKLYPADHPNATTGFGRTPFFEGIKPFIRPNGTYIEVGASLGIFAVDVKKALKFKRLVAADIMSEKQAREITFVTDFQKGGKVPFTEKQREKVEKNIDIRLWKFDILEEKIAPYVPGKQGFFCFGFHNVLAHLIDKDVAVQNAIEGLAKPGDVIWMSGGYSANVPILRNMFFVITAKGAETYLIDMKSDKAIHLDSLGIVSDNARKGRTNI